MNCTMRAPVRRVSRPEALEHWSAHRHKLYGQAWMFGALLGIARSTRHVSAEDFSAAIYRTVLPPATRKDTDCCFYLLARCSVVSVKGRVHLLRRSRFARTEPSSDNHRPSEPCSFTTLL